jgi:hypothetical protein
VIEASKVLLPTVDIVELFEVVDLTYAGRMKAVLSHERSSGSRGKLSYKNVHHQ